MIWSKIRKQLHDLLAENLKGRLDYHMTSYKGSTGYIGRAWITLDGEQLVNFSNQDTFVEFGTMSNISADTIYKDQHEPIKNEERSKDKIMEKGEFSKYDFTETAWEFIRMDIESAMISENPILRSFAAVDRRVGMKRIEKLKSSEKHPMVLRLLEIREQTD